jgi:hypothetical protein
MATDSRQRIEYVCGLAIALFFPLVLRYPPLAILSVFGLIGVYYLWFARQYLTLGLSLTLAIVGTVMWRGSIAGIVLMTGLVIPSMVMSYMRNRGIGPAPAVAAGALFPVLAVAVNFSFFVKMLEFLATQLKQTAYSAQMPGFYTPQQQQIVLDTMTRLADNLPYYYPAAILMLIVSLFSAGVLGGNYLVRAMGHFARPIAEFSLWKLPEWLAIPLGVAVILVLTNQPILAILGWNVLFFLAAIYSVCGLSLVEYLLRVRQLPLVAKIGVYLVLFLTQIVAGILLPLAALLDSRFDFRKIRAKQLG